MGGRRSRLIPGSPRGPGRDGIAAEGVAGALRHDLSRLVNAGSQVVEVARIVEIVEVDERRRRRIAAGEAHRAAAAHPQGADTHAESALAAARPPPVEQEGKEVVLDVGMRGLWARAREGTDLDLRRGAYSAPGEEPLGTDHELRERPGVAVARVAPVRPPLHVHFQVILQIRRNTDAATARSGSAPIASPSSAVRRCAIVISWHIRGRIRIARHFAAHPDRRPCPPDAPVTLWTTREMERDRFRSADRRVDRSEMMMARNSAARRAD